MQELINMQSYGIAGWGMPTCRILSECSTFQDSSTTQTRFLRNKPSENLGEKPTRPEQVFGADVTGPHPVSPAGFQDFLEVICFLGGYGYSFPIRAKAAAAEQFQALIMRLENTDKVPECTEVYVSDHGGDTIMSLSFQQFLESKGIFWQTNYNGLVERNIQSKNAIQRALHAQSGLSMGYRPLTSAAARMILNQLPRFSNPNNCTPYEAYFRRKPDLSSF